ncbi:hypothetical protein AVEN_122570-1 [Araneus ventricosus]|uniref:Uncharacterized protein n=1 Tax=Araneus ventricosus TaxID=182803 RepID=A0A4Y2UTC8_ARAVE|nr:hypothetical protein AVEN_270437-1 [Araneus ventricosus]GBO15444.1 hypothetical protein AVEN_275519-1 [Araneus ventricosus]GBO15449.1 hypothetical protein AVEN_91651-1 [Araneus ventricosus]GBO15451.1 hypothetical protein AVEN_122570-1 [Araneus ventricosus]
MAQPLPKEVRTISDGGTQSPTINIPPGEASARLLIRVLVVTPRRKQAEVNKTAPLNEVGDLNKEKPKAGYTHSGFLIARKIYRVAHRKSSILGWLHTQRISDRAENLSRRSPKIGC